MWTEYEIRSGDVKVQHHTLGTTRDQIIERAQTIRSDG